MRPQAVPKDRGDKLHLDLPIGQVQARVVHVKIDLFRWFLLKSLLHFFHSLFDSHIDPIAIFIIMSRNGTRAQSAHRIQA